ncbi:MAG: bifunctional (p)ppGpp synthetase/guanosine-3',5'-bis(diphosphate) 3'-pyrophosphohydrolase [Oscillospiraceae bacterium]|jgi:GTP pyrophosphokinase|nr:bifunctional (p)ppGpp synthetase/guanosine-3',5'-bis(diphosphate) 3'-pyrophosphohydrolase [Oscillospiraceae bacterium]
MFFTFDNLLKKIKIGEKNYDADKITAAYDLASSAHEGQTRSSGEPYISHPVAVALILLEMCMDTDTITASLLHDVVEDTNITLDVIRKKFGSDVAALVDGVTKIGLVPLNTSKEEQNAENIRKILIAMSRDIRVIIIKLADRLHNMRTLGFTDPEKQRRVSLETMSFYAPIAHRLGIADMKEEMEDISLSYLDAYAFKEIEEKLKIHKRERDEFIEKIKERIIDRVGDMNPPPVIEGRVKGIYSIYKKVYINGKDFEEIYDVYAVRIIVRSDIDCYNVLGIIHDMFTPIPYRFKDYIATPKANRYQSLHTTVLGKEGVPFEVQIRTVEMHNTAQHGVAAHWRYKAGLSLKRNTGERFDWIRRILEQQQESDDVEQIAESIKVDLAPDEVHVFTPQGDVKSLPEGSTVIDFAYSIHTHIGNKMTGARVSGRMVKFDYVLKTGDIVEIMTTNSADYGPNPDWLNIAKSGEAKAKIRNWLKRERRDENIEAGRAFVESELKRDNIEVKEEELAALAEKHRFNSLEDFYAAIGYGGVTATKVSFWIKEDFVRKDETAGQTDPDAYIAEIRKKKQSRGVIVEGIEDCLVKFAQCCNPLPGDEIIGFVTRGYGVSVHKKSCVNVQGRLGKPDSGEERWLETKWADGSNILYSATLDIIATERKGLIADITVAIASNNISISGLVGRVLKNGNASVLVTIEIAGVEQLNGIISKLNRVQGVISTERAGK